MPSSKISLHDVDNTIASLVERPVNNNILINSNFANPVNQRGVTADTWVNGEYGIDRWQKNLGANLSLSASGIIMYKNSTTNKSRLNQFIEPSCFKSGVTYSVSACVDGEIISGTFIVGETAESEKNATTENGDIAISAYLVNGNLCFAIDSYSDNPHTIEWAKLELGNRATPYVPRLYAEELALCKGRYEKQNVIGLKTSIKADSIAFVGQLRGNALINPPTITIGDGGVMADNVFQSGFEYSISSCSKDVVLITARKASHGLSSSNVYLNIDLIIDAEL